jgi:hypothetical protein
MQTQAQQADLFTNTQLADTSRKLFNDKLHKFVAMLPASTTLDALLNSPATAAKALTANTNITQTSANRHLFYSAVVAYLKHTDKGRRIDQGTKDEWLTLQKENWEERRQAALDNAPSEANATAAATIHWNDIIRARDSLPSGSPERLLLSLYTYLPPLRADYFEVAINPPPAKQRDPKANFVLLQLQQLVIRDFKTAAKYKEIKHTLPPPLLAEIEASMKIDPRHYLFVMPTDKTRPYDRNGFSKWANKQLQQIFKVPITLTTLRHLYVSTLDFNTTRARDLERIGNSMGHSIAMQKGYQWIGAGPLGPGPATAGPATAGPATHTP